MIKKQKKPNTLGKNIFLIKLIISDPYLWTFDHEAHTHFVLYLNEEIIGYCHIQLWPKARATLRIIVIQKEQRNKGFGGIFLNLCEDYLKENHYIVIQTESNEQALSFYLNHGYIKMAFDDPDGYETDPSDIPLGKLL